MRVQSGSPVGVALIRIAQRVGIPLAEVAGVLEELPEGRVPTRRDWQRLSRCWRASIEERIRDLERLRDDFTDCIGCGCLSIDRCKLANPYDKGPPNTVPAPAGSRSNRLPVTGFDLNPA